jgi:hypothetical protein
MRTKAILLAVLCVSLVPAMGRADFKYTRTSQITGGAMAGMIKTMGMFSKRMREPAESTTYVKGDFLRTDQADGSYQIIDVDGKRIIQVDPKKHAYSVMTFDQMREAMEKMQARMNEEMKKQAKEKGTTVTMTPKFEITPSGRTQTLLGQTAQEVKIKIDMEIQSQSAEKGTQSGSFTTAVDSWVAPSVSGYGEVMALHKKLAEAMNWSPVTVFGMDPRVRQSLVELYKSGKIPQGLPLLQVISLEAAPQAGAQPAQTSQQSQSSSSPGETATPSDVAAKAIGGVFGGFGGFGHKKKKKPEQEQAAPAQSSQNSEPPSLMEITSRVTSYSTDSVDSSLFQIPAGYTQVESKMAQEMERGH